MSVTSRPAVLRLPQLSAAARQWALAYTLEDQEIFFREKLSNYRTRRATESMNKRINDKYRLKRLYYALQMLRLLQSSEAELVAHIEANLSDFYPDGRPHYYMRPNRPALEAK